MKVRILTALVLLCVLVPVLIFSGTVVFPFVAAFFSVVAVSEMQKCLGTWNKLYVSIPACLLSALLPLGLLFFVKIGEGLTVSFASPMSISTGSPVDGRRITLRGLMSRWT